MDRERKLGERLRVKIEWNCSERGGLSERERERARARARERESERERERERHTHEVRALMNASRV